MKGEIELYNISFLILKVNLHFKCMCIKPTFILFMFQGMSVFAPHQEHVWTAGVVSQLTQDGVVVQLQDGQVRTLLVFVYG